MKKEMLLRALFLCVMLSAILPGCKLDPPVYPSSETPATTPEPSNNNPNNSTALTASTVVSGSNKLPQPSRLCTTTDGTIYVTSMSQGKVFRVTSAGIVKLVAQGLNKPLGIKSDLNDNIYVAITGDNKIIKITPSGKVTDVVINMPINGAQDLAIADDGSIYITDTGNKRILKVSATGTATVFAGKINVSGLKDGTGAGAHFSFPTNIRIAADGFIWVIDGDGVNKSGQTIRRITKSGRVNTYYSSKKKALAIIDLAVARRDKALNSVLIGSLFLIFSDNTLSHLGTNGVETVISPTTTSGLVNGDLKQAQFSKPTGISISGNKMYIADQNNDALRKIVSSKIN